VLRPSGLHASQQRLRVMATGAVTSSPVLLQQHGSLGREAVPSPPSIKVTSAHSPAKAASTHSRAGTPSRASSAKREKATPTPQKDWPDDDSIYEEVLDDCQPFQYSNGEWSSQRP